MHRSGGIGITTARATALACVLALAPAPARAAPEWTALGAEALDAFRAYLRIDSSNPPGDEIGTAAFFAEILAREGVPFEVHESAPGRRNVVARLAGRGAKKPIVLMNHMDVVPVDAERWTVPPFSGELRDGFVWGRGAIDTKITGIVQLMTLLAFHREGRVFDRDVVFLAVADEEAGGRWGAEWMVRNRWKDVEAEYLFDEGGFGLRYEVGGEPETLFLVSVAEKRPLWLKVHAGGTSGHGSKPHGDNANDRLVRALGRILDHDTPMEPVSHSVALAAARARNQGGVEGLVARNLDNPVLFALARGSIESNPNRNALFRDTCSLTMLQAGTKVNVIPSSAEASLDCRLLPDTDAAAFVETLREVVDDPKVRFEAILETPKAPASSTETPLFEAIRAVLTRNHPGAAVTPYMVMGATDSRFFRAEGVTCYGLVPGIVGEELVSTIHNDDERVPVATLAQALRDFYEILDRFLEGRRE